MELPDINSLASLAPVPLLILFCNFVGWLCSLCPIVGNKYIPLIMFCLGAAFYPAIVRPEKKELVRVIMIGACIGGAAVGTNQAFRQIMNKNV